MVIETHEDCDQVIVSRSLTDYKLRYHFIWYRAGEVKYKDTYSVFYFDSMVFKRSIEEFMFYVKEWNNAVGQIPIIEGVNQDVIGWQRPWHLMRLPNV